LKRKANLACLLAALILAAMGPSRAIAEKTVDRSWILLNEAGPLGKWLRPHLDYCDSTCTVGTENIEMGPFISNPNKLDKKSIFVSLVGLYVSPKMLEALANSPNLRNLYVSNTNFDDKACERISTCPNLYSIDLSWDNITNDGLQSLAKLDHLHIIKLRGIKVTPEMAATLGKMTNLDYLDISESDLGSVQNVLMAKGFANLRTLGLQNIDFSRFKPPDRELYFPKLRTVAMDQSKVSSKFLDIFVGLPAFKVVRAFSMAEPDRKAVRQFGKQHKLYVFEEQYMRGH
jgi:hypothetical protein